MKKISLLLLSLFFLIVGCKKTDDEGRTSVTDDGTTVTVKSCTKKDETILSGTVTIE